MDFTGTNNGETLTGTLGDDVISALDGNDTINITQGNDVVDGGTGTDRATITMSNAARFAAATGSRTYTFTSSSLTDTSGILNTALTSVERLTFNSAGTGDFDDVLDASGFVAPATGAFVLNATLGNGDNTVTGTGQNDFIWTGSGDDHVSSGAGNDTLSLGAGSNWADAGAGFDYVQATIDNSSGSVIYITGSGGTVQTVIDGVVTNTVLNVEDFGTRYTAPNAAVTTVNASGLSGLAGTLYLDDTDGSTISIGHSGVDFFVGNSTYTQGNDVFTGNGGADIYDYTWAVNAMDGDTITDLDGDDIIDLQFNTASHNSGGLLANQFIGNFDFSGIAGEYRFYAEGGQTFVQVDHSGDGVADETLTIANGQFALGLVPGQANQLQIYGLAGTAGNDFYVGTLGNDDYYGFGGNDVVGATSGMDFLFGGEGWDQLRFNTFDANRFTTATGSRTFTITNEWVGASDGSINTYHSEFEVLSIRTTGTGDFGDTIDASALTNAAVSLSLRLGAGDDVVIGGAGDDSISLGLGINSANGGSGFDTVFANFDSSLHATAYVTNDGGTVFVTAYFMTTGTVVATIVNAEEIHVEGISTNSAAITIDASGFTPTAGVTLVLRDSNGDDVIFGSSGADILSNVSGHSTGSDAFTGNGGADIFDWTYASDAINGDVIWDFDSDDKLDFRFNDGTVVGASPLLVTNFIGNAAFSGSAGEYRFEWGPGETYLQFDTDGDGAADQSMTLANGQYALVETAPGSNILMRANLIEGDNNGNLNLRGSLGNDVIYGYDLPDRIYASQGIDYIDGGGFNDRLTVNLWDTTLFEAPTDARTYTITNTRFTDSSGLINTTMTSMERLTFSTQGLNFNDTIDVSGWVSGAPSGIVTLLLGNGNNTVIGSQYGDFILVGTGHNVIDGGAGIDEVQMQFDNNAGQTLFITGSGGSVAAEGSGLSNQSLTSVENLWFIGTNPNLGTTIDASGLTGFSGMLGYGDSNGSNILIGHSGSDFFANGHAYTAGNDVYTGNGGADIYDYTWAVNAMDGDTITDFDGDDIIDLQFNTASQNSGGLLADKFIGNAAFSNVAGQYRYFASGGKTYVQVDTNGDGVADETLTIANGQFVLKETAPGSNQLKIAGQVITGTGASDTLTGTKGDDIIDGLGSSDLLNATQGADFIDGGAGTVDRLMIVTSLSSRFDAVVGPRTYTLTATSASDSSGLLNTTMVNVERITLDTRNTGDFATTVDASAFTSAASAAMTIFTGAGNDIVYGSGVADYINVGAGNNVVQAGGGSDTIAFFHGSAPGTTLIVTGSGGNVFTTDGGSQTNSFYNVEFLQIGSDSTTSGMTVDASGLTGLTGRVVYVCLDGVNTIVGHSGVDFFSNTSTFLNSVDTFTGNGGADIYDYTFAVGGMDGDTITDLDGDDIIDFKFNNPTNNGGGLLADKFIGNAAFSNVAGQYRYYVSGGKTYVQADTNGDGVADETLTIANGQFVLKETAPGSNQLKIAGQYLTGTANADTLTTSKGDDIVDAQGSNDSIIGSQGADVVNGGLGGADRLFMYTGDSNQFTLATGARAYVIGANSITDSSGTLNTSFTGVERILLSTVGNGNFNDTFDASGFVSTHGTPLDIRLGDGNNLVTGSAGNDRVFGGFGGNTANGGTGYDYGLISVNAAAAVTVTITNVGGTLTTNANGVVNQFTNFEEIWVQGFGAGAITLDASAYTDIPGLLLVLVGHDGSDIMVGSAGNDLFANITGQVSGNDVYTGNGGADIYDYTWAADSMNGDTITDFDIDDVIDLRFNNLNPGGSPVKATTFIGANAFSGAAGEYRYQINGTTTVVQVDSDGDGLVDQTLTITNGGFALAETAPGSNILTLAAVINPLDGIVADGYVAGATLFIDTNGNHLLDDGEAWTTTDANGNFALNVNQGGTLVAVGGTNADTLLANGMTLLAPLEAGVVNPLTTLIQVVIEQSGLTAAQAEAQVSAALGLAASLDLLNADLLAMGGNADALAAQKAAALVANLVAAAEDASGAGGGTESALVGALADLIVATSGGSTIDLTDAATLTPLLSEALPGSPDVGAIAAEAAIEGDAIAAATSLSGISNAQYSAQTVDYALDNDFTGTALGDHIYGLGGNDTLSGLAGDDLLDGGIGNDVLNGGIGNDKLYGGDGDDRLVGGDGMDFFWGGAGNDRFVAEFGTTKVATKVGTMSVDVVFDFRAGDKIDLSGLDANSTKPGLQMFNWKGSNSNKAAGDLSFKSYDSVQGAEKALGIDIDGVNGPSPYSGPVTIVYGNHDGGTPDFAMVLIGVGSLSSSDFIFGTGPFA